MLVHSLLICAIGAILSRADVVSRATYYDLTPENEITCIGHIPKQWQDWDRTFLLPFPYHALPASLQTFFRFGHGLYRLNGSATTLAQLCAHSTGVTCMQDADLRPQHLEYPLLLQLEAEAGQGEIRGYDFTRPIPISSSYLDQPNIRSLQKAAEFCRTKCKCTTLQQSLDRAAMRSPYAPTRSTRQFRDNRVLVWNFDTRSAKARPREPAELTWWKNGLVRTTFSLRNQNEGAELLSHYYVGDPENRPVCDNRPFADPLQVILNTYTNEEYTTASELCNHRYYGGNNYTSMGGVCLRSEDGSRRDLTFPYELISPEFTREFPREDNLQTLTFPIAVETFCKRYCSCGDSATTNSSTAASAQTAVTGLESWANLASGGDCSNQQGRLGACPAPETVAPEEDYSPSPKRQKSTGGNGTCPTQCHYADSSSRPVCGDGCECRAFQSIDPVFPATPDSGSFLSWCVSSAIAAAAASMMSENGKGIVNGKLVPRTFRMSGCPCNLTYVSQRCCEVDQTGLVWEDAGMKMGEILRL